MQHTMLAKFGMCLIILLIAFGCSNLNPLDEFTFSFSVESVNNYKTELLINKDSTYKISKYNYFFDNFEGKRKPLHIEGRLTSRQFNTIQQLLTKSRLFKMKDDYGFNEEKNSSALTDVIWQISLHTPENQKFITIKPSRKLQFSKPFLELIDFSDDLINERINEAETN